MSLQLKKQVKNFKTGNKGSFTLEASLIFPIIFIITIALVLFSLVVYENAVLYQRAHLIAERVAFSWDNSQKDFEDGSFEINQYNTMDGGDGLYWRIGAVASGLIEKATKGQLSGGGSTATSRKVSKGNDMAHEIISNVSNTGDVVKYRIFNTSEMAMGMQTIEVELIREINLPPFVDLITDSEISATAVASIKDPVEVIRTTDFLYYFIEEMADMINNE
ncbi:MULTISPECIES: hypothetical protein [Bacillaceae]|uniref:TadE-like protein n=1 Tax=Evansella alkalicola TaxID=745819 RepID=A0ABS6K1C9_9BACI|nr:MULTISPECIES: hypothetical protein [Bacillaceae]MBU9724252.1 hypothetical protein [Bacillus alkalicola]